jgi:hypothetical protein
MLEVNAERGAARAPERRTEAKRVDMYFSADVETDGPIPGPYSMLSLALVYAGRFDGEKFERPESYADTFYRELRPISDTFEIEAMAINGLDRDRLMKSGDSPDEAMTAASAWVKSVAGSGRPVLVAYPLSFDWTWLYWYFVRFARNGSPFNHSSCFDLKTAVAVKRRVPVSQAGRDQLDPALRPTGSHTHHALDDAIEQAEIFANVFEWEGADGPGPGRETPRR